MNATKAKKTPKRTESLIPDRKVGGAFVGGNALATIFIWMLSNFGVDVPNDVAMAIGVVIGTTSSFLAGYFIPRKEQRSTDQ